MMKGGVMADRVLSTEQAKSSIRQMQSIINGGLSEQITALDTQGKSLSDPNVWDGPLADQFRGDQWPGMKNALETLKQQLDDMRGRLDKISTDIFTAGGGG
jgi:hypothetical protein